MIWSVGTGRRPDKGANSAIEETKSACQLSLPSAKHGADFNFECKANKFTVAIASPRVKIAFGYGALGKFGRTSLALRIQSSMARQFMTVSTVNNIQETLPVSVLRLRTTHCMYRET